jgi:hypothetical protein
LRQDTIDHDRIKRVNDRVEGGRAINTVVQTSTPNLGEGELVVHKNGATVTLIVRIGGTNYSVPLT